VSDLLQAPWTIRIGILALAAALAISIVTDLRRRLILNWVTIPALALVIGLSGAAGGWPLVRNSLLGMAICALPLLVAAIPGWVGMGDVKLIAVCGAAAGYPAAVAVLVLVTAAGGLQAALQLALARIRGTGRPTHVPYACSIAAGTLAAFLLGGRFP
jgi:leader peptidase (prepilin peptidase) / N-methyltransferase